VIEFMQDPIRAALEKQRASAGPQESKSVQLPLSQQVWVFLDEINTADCMGLFKEIVCDHSLNGYPLPANLVVLAACSPYRFRHDAQQKTGGLSRGPNEEQKLKKDSLRRLVYRVYPLPETMQMYLWDFGRLGESEEGHYIKALVSSRLAKIVPSNDQEKLVNVIGMAHEYLRKELCDVGAVSLRDVLRCVQLISYFSNQLKCPSSHAIALGVAHCYYYRLPRDKYDAKTVVIPFVKNVEVVFGINFQQCLERYQNQYLQAMQMKGKIARNRALKENIFVMLVCVMNKIPVVVVGKPGAYAL
jgi:hypothetical protein